MWRSCDKYTHGILTAEKNSNILPSAESSGSSKENNKTGEEDVQEKVFVAQLGTQIQ